VSISVAPANEPSIRAGFPTPKPGHAPDIAAFL
jgi:hypothetical protein